MFLPIKNEIQQYFYGDLNKRLQESYDEFLENQHNPNNITEKPPHYRSKSDGGAVLLYLDFLTVLEGEADIVSAVSRSTPTQSQRNRIFFGDGKVDFICFAVFCFTSGLQHAFVLFSDSIAQPAPGRCRFERVWDFPTSILQRKMVFVYTKTLLAGHIPFSSRRHKTFPILNSIQTVQFLSNSFFALLPIWHKCRQYRIKILRVVWVQKMTKFVQYYIFNATDGHFE